MKRTLLILLTLVFLNATPVSAYIVKNGDTLWGISKQTGISVDELVRKNNIENRDLIFVGQEINFSDGSLLGYTPPTGYSARTTQFINGSTATIPVNTTRDLAENEIDLTQISSASVVKIYMTLDSGTPSQESVVCTGKVTSTSWIGCTRGLSFQGSSETASTTLQKSHNAGTPVIITNIAQFYNQFVSVDGAQTINNAKTFSGTTTFNILPVATTSAPTLPGNLITLEYLTSVTTTGCANATASVRGCVQESTTSTNFSGNALGSTGARLFLSPASLTTSSDYATKKGFVPVLRTDSQLDASFGGNPGSLATLDAGQKVIQNPASATTSPTTSSIPLTSASSRYLDDWVSTTNSFPYMVSSLTNNSQFTYTIPMQVNIAPAAAGDNTNGWRNMYAAGATADGSEKHNNIASTTLNGAQQYSATIMGTSTEYSFFGNGVGTTTIKFRARALSSDGETMYFGLIPPTNVFNAASTTNAPMVAFTWTGTAAGAGTNFSSQTSAGAGARTVTVSTGLTHASWNSYVLSYSSSTAQFFVNNILKATHTTNLPTSSTMKFGFGGSTSNLKIQFTDPIITQQL